VAGHKRPFVINGWYKYIECNVAEIWLVLFCPCYPEKHSYVYIYLYVLSFIEIAWPW